MINEVIERLSKKYDVDVFFDDSRMWTLGYKDKYGVYCGVQRPYLGGGVRGGIRSNLEGEELEDFKNALLEIKKIINSDTEGLESWEQNTGVLL